MKNKILTGIALSGAILVLNADAKTPAKKASVQTAKQQSSAEKLFQQVQKKYTEARSIYCEFRSDNNAVLNGSMKAQRGNKFVLNVADRTIVSNGSTIWNYTKKNNTVLVSTGDGSYQGTPIEQILFTFLKSYTLSESKSAGPGLMQLTIVPRTAKETIQNVRSLTLTVDTKSLALKAASMNSDDGTHNFTIKKIRTDMELPPSEFEFQAPKGTKIVDMR